MGDLDITAANVRGKLRSINVSTSDVSDTELANNPLFIPLADGWASQILTENSVAEANLTTYQEALIKAAKVLVVCCQVVTDAPTETFDIMVKGKAVATRDKTSLVETWEKQITKFLELAGLCEKVPYVGTAEGDDMHPDDEDNTNVDFSHAENESDDPFRVFS